METKTATSNIPTMSASLLKWLLALAMIAAVVIAAVAYQDRWLPEANKLLGLAPAKQLTGHEGHNHAPGAAHDDHEVHDDHDHAGHVEANSVELSPQARRNVGLSTNVIALETFVRTVTMPAIVVGRPGRSQIDVTAPLGGRVTRVYPIAGEAVQPGQLLFELRLTHEELVQAQSELLKSVEQLDVERAEIARLEGIVDSGAIPAKRVLERQYEKQKIEATINSQRQSLLLHGLSEEQVNSIVKDRMLVQGITVVAPNHPERNAEEKQPAFTVRKLHVKPGQYVDAGAPMCLLMDYGELYIEGHAFEQDNAALLKATQEAWPIRAIPEGSGNHQKPIEGLSIVYVDNEIEPVSRSLHFYVRLTNEVVHVSEATGGHRFLTWKYKPGARMQLLVPVEQWAERIVLPVDAVARDGAENYVFQQNGNHFDRVPVQVEYQDQFNVVLANDGSIFPGDTVASSGAHQLQMALKNKAGGGVDPHAGHNH